MHEEEGGAENNFFFGYEDEETEEIHTQYLMYTSNEPSSSRLGSYRFLASSRDGYCIKIVAVRVRVRNTLYACRVVCVWDADERRRPGSRIVLSMYRLSSL